MTRHVCEVHRLGIVDYQAAWDLQNQLAAEIAGGDRPATLLLLEHPHTYTFGRRGQAANLLWDPSELARRGIEVHWVDRGGDVTYHGPGQLVGYPLLPLGRPTSQGFPALAGGADLTGSAQNHMPKADYVGYIRKLEQVLIKAVAEYGVAARQIEGLTGVWVDDDRSGGRTGLSLEDEGSSIAKLAAIGVKVDASGISRHGFALNVDPDMRYWEGIVGCGLPYLEVSLAGLLNPVPAMDVISKTTVDFFGEIFDFEINSSTPK